MIADYQVIVAAYVRDDASVISSGDIDSSILAAVEELDRHSPKTLIQELTSVTATKQFALPGDWQSGFSQMASVEYPTGEQPPSLIKDSDRMIWGTPSGEFLVLSEEIPASAPLWVAFTSSYTLSGVADDIPTRYRHPVSLYAAALVCEALATFYSGESDSNFNADVADHGGKSKYYRSSATRYKTMFYSFFGVSPPKATSGPSSAGKIVEAQLPETGTGGMFRGD